MTITCEPKKDQWIELIQENVSVLSQLSLNRATLQQALLLAAKRYEQDLLQLSERRSLEIAVPKVPDACDEHFLGTGHQSVLFHQGIARKYKEVDAYAASASVRAFHLILDRDHEWAGSFTVPFHSHDVLGIQHLSLGKKESVFAEFETVSYKDEQLLEFLPYAATLTHGDIQKAHEIYRACDGASITLAHSLVRLSILKPAAIHEVPFSYLIDQPEIQAVLFEIVERGAGLHDLYNELLDEYRRERKIKNEANPFPNLRADKEQYGKELPFWAFHREAKSRSEVSWYQSEPIVLEGGKPVSLKGNASYVILPRGALNSLFYRLHLFDYFVHGLGGERYDRFTDLLIQKLYGIPPPHFAVVSETKYLFQEATKLKELEEQVNSLRSIYTHPLREDFVTLFSDDQRSHLESLCRERDELVQTINQTSKGMERAEIGKKLNRVNGSIRAKIDEFIGSAWKSEHEALLKNKAAYLWREYPFFTVRPD